MHNKFFYIWKYQTGSMKDLTIDHALRATWQAVSKMYNEEAKNYDLTMAIGFTLLSIDPKGGTPSTTLGPKMGMEATSLSRILKTIEQKGYIERRPNPNDGRGVLIYLTQLGLEKREGSKDVVLRFNEVVREHVSDKDLEGFFKTIDVINKLITDKKIYIKTTNN